MKLRQLIPPETWDELLRIGTRRVFRADSPLMLQGEPPTFVLALTEGTVKITEDTDDGRQVPLALRGPGDLFGETGVLLEQPRSATAWTTTRCVGHAIPAPTFRSFAERCKLHTDIYRLSVARFLQREEHLSNLLCHTPDVRMARLLGHLADEVGEPQGANVVIHIGMSREELGLMVRMSRATAIDTLHRLQSLGLIRCGRKRIEVLNRSALQRYSSD
ncbi:Crp/Fnr family transcriptional regulator [Thermobifida alba]|jgi:CRP/FNR family cyclic AMP-dependent transcriptional regulator|uniref:Crp/Fnr family transcriptional regulator n=1 Tax=Thermobifida alba TaxID=53522 RepID=A0ABY4L9G6_THEAE|nr:Crp/Fnr family transcriptional regulator [Thermobifida alba]UPT23093.1 Crp/Fnr family transcriptional regulator [Thermobifida alba]